LHDTPSPNSRREVATYDYVDERGELLFQVVRYEPKGFSQRRPNGNGGWTYNLDGSRRVIYRLPAVVEAVKSGRRIFVVEGERDVHALEAAGEVATTPPMGAGKWRDEYGEALRGASVLVVADDDDAGRGHALRVATSLEGVAAEVCIVQAAEGKDARDHLEAGRDVEGFEVMWEPVTLAPLLDAIAAALRRYVVMSEEQAVVVALWVIHTHAIEAADMTPYLAITSPEKRSGKSLLLEMLRWLAARAQDSQHDRGGTVPLARGRAAADAAVG
jgi:5S rRNA maturation endonuclease (ribonuclease M5)